MKPRIKLWTWDPSVEPFWTCKVRGMRTGYGGSPAGAYSDWKWRNRLC